MKSKDRQDKNREEIASWVKKQRESTAGRMSENNIERKVKKRREKIGGS